MTWDRGPESAHDMIIDERRKAARSGGHPYMPLDDRDRPGPLQSAFWLVMIAVVLLLLAVAALRAWDYDLAHDYARPDVEARKAALRR